MAANPHRTRALRLQVGHRSVTGIGMERRRFGDIFYLCMSMSWPRLLLCYGLFFILINIFFAGLFALDPLAVVGQRPARWIDLMFFSVEVFGTVSFGGFQPSSAYGHVVASAEILCGIASYAFMTGLTFARFTRPTAEILFAHHPLVTLRDGQRMLVTRVANMRHNELSDVQAKCWLMINEIVDGKHLGRRIYRATLLRDDNPLLILSWSLYHVIDASSPLFGMDALEMERRDVNIAYIVSGHDEGFTQEIRARHFYQHEEIRWHHAYVDTVIESSPGQVHVDFSKFHHTRRLDPPSEIA